MSAGERRGVVEEGREKSFEGVILCLLCFCAVAPVCGSRGAFAAHCHGSRACLGARRDNMAGARRQARQENLRVLVEGCVSTARCPASVCVGYGAIKR